MAKLYWRVKKDGKWTWRPAESFDRGADYVWVRNLPELQELQEEEE